MTSPRFALLLALAMADPAAAHGATPAVDSTAAADTLRRVVPLPVVEVSTTRAGDTAPLARTVLGRAALLERNLGLDTPMLLATLPGAYAYSDAGNGIGYSYLSLRGFPQRRISVLVNGVPLNDPESHEVYWIDHPDLLASAAEVQLQRGVGSALYGAAAVGGSVAIETSPFSDAPEMRATLAYGSWETKRLMLEMNSGRLEGGWNLYGRTSRIETFGYRDQSWSRLWSYALSARRTTGTQSWRVNLYGGPEETHLAYLGVPAAYLDGDITGDRDRDRRFNPITYPNERDHFFEPHYELIHAWAPAPAVAMTQTLFWFDGRGYYDEQRFGQDLAGYRLSPWTTTDSTLYAPEQYAGAPGPGGAWVPARDSLGRFTVERFDAVRRRTVFNRHYGWVPRMRIAHAAGALTIGGELRAHDGRHFGEVISGDGLPPGTPPDHRYYDYHPRTLASGVFVREEWNAAARVMVTGDLAWRHQSYAMRDDRFDGVRFDQHYDFALPRLGVTFTASPALTAYASWSAARREPALRDLYDGEGVGNVPLFARVDPANGWHGPLIRPEHVRDWEAGATWRRIDATLTANLFRMEFRDELVYAGQFDTDLGYPILGNAARSLHQGVELSGAAARALPAGVGVRLEGNATFADHHFVDYHEVYGTAAGDTVRYDGNRIGQFPATLANLSARLSWRGASVSFDAQHAGRIFLDNTAAIAASIGPHTVFGITALVDHALGRGAGAARASWSLRVQNLADAHYAAGGYMDYDALGNLVPVFIPAATRNVLGQFSVRF